MIPNLTFLSLLVLLVNGIRAAVWLDGKLYKPHGKTQSATTEIDFDKIEVPDPASVNNLTIEHSTILNANYSGLKKFQHLYFFLMTDVTDAPRITKELFQQLPRINYFALRAKDSSNEVEFEEDAFSDAYKMTYLYIERLYTISRLSSRFLLPSLNHLRQLTLDNGALSVIEADAFDFTTKINYLSLRGHGSIRIEDGAFKRLTELQFLYLDGNNIENFSWNTFRVLPKVEDLSLSNIHPDQLVGRKIRKHFPELRYLTVFTDNCKQYGHISRNYNGLMIFFKSNNVYCPKM